MDAAVDTAAAAHQMLDRLPEHKRTAALMLLDLPVDWPLCRISGPCVNYCEDPEDCPEVHPDAGTMTAGQLLRDLMTDIAQPQFVFDVLGYYKMIRPGLGGVR